MPVQSGPIPGTTVLRPDSGTVTRPSTGVVTRPDTGTITRPHGPAAPTGPVYIQ
jgi:hypothetical protein